MSCPACRVPSGLLRSNPGGFGNVAEALQVFMADEIARTCVGSMSGAGQGREVVVNSCQRKSAAIEALTLHDAAGEELPVLAVAAWFSQMPNGVATTAATPMTRRMGSAPSIPHERRMSEIISVAGSSTRIARGSEARARSSIGWRPVFASIDAPTM